MSDHISGPRALADPIADITDVYAFPKPGAAGAPRAGAEHAAVRTGDRPVLRRARVPLPAAACGRGGCGAREQSPFDVHDAEELVFDCVFSEPTGDGWQEGTCHTPSGDTVAFVVDDEQGGSAHGVRAFAGVRWDPFIMDAPAALKTIATGQLAFTDPGSIYMDGKNVLSIVLEIDCAKYLPGVQLVGVVSETLTRGKVSVRIERVGRPEVKNLLLAPKQFDQVNRDLEIRDIYNMEDGFHLADGYVGAYRARLNANLRFWDGLDGKLDWPYRGRHAPTDRARPRRLPGRRCDQAVCRAGVVSTRSSRR